MMAKIFYAAALFFFCLVHMISAQRVSIDWQS